MKLFSVVKSNSNDLFQLRIENVTADDAEVEFTDPQVSFSELRERYTFIMTRPEIENLAREVLTAVSLKRKT